LILGRLAASTAPRDMNLPGLHLHPLKGRSKGAWAVDVSGNWRVIFRFDGTDAVDVDYIDYH
jgi:proteic killer suppression protein